jgi:hypothetical protein
LSGGVSYRNTGGSVLLRLWRLSTEAVRTQSPNLVLGESLSAFMRSLGLQPTGGKQGTIARLRKQMERLFRQLTYA